MSNTPSLQQHFKTVHLVVDMQHMWAEQLAPEDQAELPGAIEAFIRATHKIAPPLYIESIDEDIWSGIDTERYHAVIEHIPSSLGRMTKTVSSAFQYGVNSDLNARLRDRGVEEVIISGGFTRRCVWETAVDAAKCGYEVTILDDLCREPASFKDSPHYPEVTAELCAAHGITLGNSAQYNNSGHFGGAAQSVAAFRM